MKRKMRRLVGTSAATLMAIGMLAGPAVADDGGFTPDPHPHHVNTGNGGCITIDAKLFAPGHGLHNGSNRSSGFDPFADPFTPPKDRGP